MKIIERITSSENTKTSLLTDGTLTCTYQDIPAIFDRIKEYFKAQEIDKEDCLALECENSLPSALVLLYLLEEEYSFLLLSKLTDKSPESKQVIPGFCRYRLKSARLTDNGNTVDLRHPEQFLHLGENESWIGHPTQANRATPKLYLRTSGSTGKPKMAVHSHAKLIGNALNCVKR